MPTEEAKSVNFNTLTNDLIENKEYVNLLKEMRFNCKKYLKINYDTEDDYYLNEKQVRYNGATVTNTWWKVYPFPVQQFKYYYIPNVMYNNVVPAIIFLDSNNKLVDYYKLSDVSGNYFYSYNHTIVAPIGATKLLIQIFDNRLEPIVYECSIIDKINQNLINLKDQFDFKFAWLDINSHITSATNKFLSIYPISFNFDIYIPKHVSSDTITRVGYRALNSYENEDWQENAAVFNTTQALIIPKDTIFTLFIDASNAEITDTIYPEKNALFNDLKIYNYDIIKIIREDEVFNNYYTKNDLNRFYGYNSIATAIDSVDFVFDYVNKLCTITLPYRTWRYIDKNSLLHYDLNGATSGTVSITFDYRYNYFIAIDRTNKQLKALTWAEFTDSTSDFYLIGTLNNSSGIPNSGELLQIYNYWNNKQQDSWIKYRIPDAYFDTGYLKEKMIQAMDNIPLHGISFAFITDVHMSVNFKQFGSIIKYIKSNTCGAIQFTIFGGDIPYVGTRETAQLNDLYREIGLWHEQLELIGADSVFPAHGNHDYQLQYTDESGNVVDFMMDKKYMISGFFYAINDKINREDDVLYYYYDVPKTKIRIVVFDSFPPHHRHENAMDYEQYVWAINKAFNCSDKHILVVAHCSMDSNTRLTNSPEMHQIIAAIKNKSTAEVVVDGNTISVDYTNTTNEIIMCLCGHQHQDEDSIEDNVLTVVCNCSAYYTSPSGYSRSGYLADEAESFDIVSIDTDARTIKFVRIGAGSDREFTY